VRNEIDLVPIKNLILGSIHMETNKTEVAQKVIKESLKVNKFYFI
jgi:hypothetical protein